MKIISLITLLIMGFSTHAKSTVTVKKLSDLTKGKWTMDVSAAYGSAKLYNINTDIVHFRPSLLAEYKNFDLKLTVPFTRAYTPKNASSDENEKTIGRPHFEYIQKKKYFRKEQWVYTAHVKLPMSSGEKNDVVDINRAWQAGVGGMYKKKRTKKSNLIANIGAQYNGNSDNYKYDYKRPPTLTASILTDYKYDKRIKVFAGADYITSTGKYELESKLLKNNKELDKAPRDRTRVFVGGNYIFDRINTVEATVSHALKGEDTLIGVFADTVDNPLQSAKIAASINYKRKF